MPQDIDPLSPELWFQRIQYLRDRLEQNAIGFEEAIRHAYHLSLLAPSIFRELIGATVPEAHLEKLLAQKRFESAAGSIITSEHFKVGVSIPDGHAVVTITSPIFDAQSQCAHEEIGQALLGAWLAALLAIRDRALDTVFIPPDQVPNKQQCGRRRPPTLH
jgi:hypothetical protein